MSHIPELQNPIAIFPLPNTVFYPKTLLPLHIFEPRYRQMIHEAVGENRLIGMVLLQPGWEKDYYGKPKINPNGCAGIIEECLRLPEGKFNIVLKGLSRFRIVQEFNEKPYRIAEVNFMESNNDMSLKEVNDPEIKQLGELFEEYKNLMPKENLSLSPSNFEHCFTLGELVDQIVYSLDFKINQKQFFLEESDTLKRFKSLLDELKLKIQIMKISSLNKKNKFDTRMN